MHLHPVTWLPTLRSYDIPLWNPPFLGPMTPRKLMAFMAAFLVSMPFMLFQQNFLPLLLMMPVAVFYGYVRGRTFAPHEQFFNWLNFVLENRRREFALKAKEKVAQR